jgi:hypothetical protein
MKKYIRKFIVFLTLLLGGTSIETTLAFADGFTKNRSESEISYRENTDSTPPIDPTHPDQAAEIISKIPVTPGTAGPLSVDFAPHVVFGQQEASKKDVIYYAALTKIKRLDSNTEEEIGNFLQLTDNRGKNSSWRLTVTQNGQLKNGAHTLKGAQLSINNITLFSPNHGAKPTASKDVHLDPENGEPTEVSRSTETSGKGTWLIMFGKNKEESKTSIQVRVPGTTEKKQGNYTTSLTWELIDTPI